MEKSLFFDSVGGDRKYNSSDFTNYFKAILTNGIFPNPSSNLQVIANGNLTVTVKPGGANINGYLYSLTTDKLLTISPTSTARKDIVVIRWDLSNRTISAIIKQNTTTLERTSTIYEICLAEITINASASSISQLNIYDTRQDTNRCGLANSLITADTTTLFKQFENGFNIWFDEVKGTLGSDAAGNLLNLITSNDTKINKKVDDLKIEVNTKISDNKIIYDNFAATKGKANGLAPLNSEGKISNSFLNFRSNTIYNYVGSGNLNEVYNISFKNYSQIEIFAQFDIYSNGPYQLKINDTILFSMPSYGEQNTILLRCIIDSSGNAYCGFSRNYGDIYYYLDIDLFALPTYKKVNLLEFNRITLNTRRTAKMYIMGRNYSEVN